MCIAEFCDRSPLVLVGQVGEAEADGAALSEGGGPREKRQEGALHQRFASSKKVQGRGPYVKIKSLGGMKIN